jgi:hypothetical protein
LGSSALEERGGVDWATLRGKQLLLAQGTTRIIVLASTVGVLYIKNGSKTISVKFYFV